jgi:hypothetical protein
MMNAYDYGGVAVEPPGNIVIYGISAVLPL